MAKFFVQKLKANNISFRLLNGQSIVCSLCLPSVEVILVVVLLFRCISDPRDPSRPCDAHKSADARRPSINNNKDIENMGPAEDRGDEEYIDLAQLASIILMPMLARAGAEWEEERRRRSE